MPATSVRFPLHSQIFDNLVYRSTYGSHLVKVVVEDFDLRSQVTVTQETFENRAGGKNGVF